MVNVLVICLMQKKLTISTIGQLINTAKKDWPHLLIAHVQGVEAVEKLQIC
jgi:hypothetical protein